MDTHAADVLQIQIIERMIRGRARSRKTAVPDRVVADSHAAVLADGEAGGVDGAGLGRVVELELLVGGDVARAALAIG